MTSPVASLAPTTSPVASLAPHDILDARLSSCVPPRAEFVDRLVVLQRPALHSKVLEVLPRLADDRARRNVEEPHDLVAVQVRPDPLQVLLRRQLADPVLEIVVAGL